MWIYEQSTGILRHNGVVIATGYSGMGADKNQPADESVKNMGPLPEGLYTVGAVMAEGPGGTGKYVLPLTPDATDVMFGRGGFYMHGDSISHPGFASEGCIVMPYAARIAVATSPDKRLQVVAAYAA